MNAGKNPGITSVCLNEDNVEKLLFTLSGAKCPLACESRLWPAQSYSPNIVEFI